VLVSNADVRLMQSKHRRLLLFLLLAGVLLLAWFAPSPVEQPVPSRVTTAAQKNNSITAARAPKQTAVDAPIATTLPQREALGKSKQDIFGFQTWQPPPPPPPKAAAAPPPPPPVPPPNPYRFAGRIMQDGQAKVFLTRGEFPVLIKMGDVLEGTYRLDAINPTNIALTYLPLDYKETIAIPTGSDSSPGIGRPSDAGTLTIPRPLVLSPG
jgi:hypothetical protein